MKLIITNQARKDLAKLDITIQRQVVITLDKYIEGNQVDILKLSGISNQYRIRLGDYRIIIERVNEDTIVIYALRVLHRREVYR
ncbi:MAG: type II toxin-antitoxin system RelE/ParE family toxin [Desulfosporosinus sp.]|nr:type II toxin-antitoxin system RelE/ParE family toxin [Desulfosporosinus sp.]